MLPPIGLMTKPLTAVETLEKLKTVLMPESVSVPALLRRGCVDERIRAARCH